MLHVVGWRLLNEQRPILNGRGVGECDFEQRAQVLRFGPVLRCVKQQQIDHGSMTIVANAWATAGRVFTKLCTLDRCGAALAMAREGATRLFREFFIITVIMESFLARVNV